MTIVRKSAISAASEDPEVLLSAETKGGRSFAPPFRFVRR